MACTPTGAPRVVNNFDWEWLPVSWAPAGVAFLSDYKVHLSKGRRCFYIVSNYPVSEVYMHFAPLGKWSPQSTWAAGGADQWIPFPGSSRQPGDINKQIFDVCKIEFDKDTFVQDFYLSAWNGAGAGVNNLMILCSSKPINFFNSKSV